MKHLLTRFFTCMIVCVCCFMYTRDAMALLGETNVRYVCAEYDDYSDYVANAVYFDWVMMSDPYTIESNVHEKCTPPSGTTFAGWLVTVWDITINGLYEGEIHQPGDVINLTVEQFFIAQYEPVGATYTVTYSCNGGTGTAPSNETATENQSFTPASNTCTKNGYAFTGWAVSGTNDVKPAGTAFTWEYTENKTFSAQWTGNTISVNWYDGEDELTGENVAGSCTYGGIFDVPNPPSRTGYVFMGWKLHTKTCPEITDQTTCNNTTGCIYNTYVSACKNYISGGLFGCYDIPDTGTCDDYAFESGRPGCQGTCYGVGAETCTANCGGAGN